MLQPLPPSLCSGVATSTDVNGAALRFPAPPFLHNAEHWLCPCPGKCPTGHGCFQPLKEKKTPLEGIHMEVQVRHCNIWLRASLKHLVQGAGGKHVVMNHREPSTFFFSSISSTRPPRAMPKAGWRGPQGLQSPQRAPHTGPGPRVCPPQQTQWAVGAGRQPSARSAAPGLWLNEKSMGNLRGNEVFAVYYTQLGIKEEKGSSRDA